MLALTPAIRLADLSPEVVLAAAGCAALIAAQAGSAAVRRLVPWITLAAIVIGIVLLRVPAISGGLLTIDSTIRGGFRFDHLADYVRIATLTLGVLLALVHWSQPSEEERGEFFSMLLFSLCGLMLMGSAANLVNLFLALELVSIPIYVMVALSRRGRLSLEAATKYFYLGAMAAAMTAFGFAYLYGVAGSATLDNAAVSRISDALNKAGTFEHALAIIGVTISISGLLFKLSAVPLHFYVADVYQGAASPVSGLLGFVPKLAGVLGILRVLQLTGWHLFSVSGSSNLSPTGLFWMLWIIAALSMTIGNVLALRQTNIKRMLAYSGIAHSGYMLVGLLAAPGGEMLSDGPGAVLYYILVYGIANLGAFALLALLEYRGVSCETVRDVAGLLRRSPGLALLMALAMFTLMGMPPTPGFWGKLSLFGSALSAGKSAGAYQPWVVGLVVIAVVNSAIAAAYYLRVIAAVLLYENDDPAEPAEREAQHMGAVLCGFLTLIFAVFPGPVFQQSKMASASIAKSGSESGAARIESNPEKVGPAADAQAELSRR